MSSSDDTIELVLGPGKCSEADSQTEVSGQREADIRLEETGDQNQCATGTSTGTSTDDKETSFCRVCVSYSSELETELQLVEGDIVKVISKRPDGWWTGSLRDKVGLFPLSFVVPITADQAREDENLTYCKVLFDCKPELPDELELLENDIIEIISKSSDGWWKGRLRDQVGMFPSNFVTLISNPSTQSTSTTSSNSSCCNAQAVHEEVILTQCQVVIPFPGNDDDELTLQDGDMITIVSKDARDNGVWWKGVLRGKTGIFPKCFVEEVPVTVTINASQNNESRSDESQSTDVPIVIAESLEMEQNLEENIEENLENSPLTLNPCSTSESDAVPVTVPVPIPVPVPKGNPETLLQCRVVAAYEQTDDDELTISEGDVITILSKQGDWWKGSLNGKTGFFPNSFVEEIKATNGERNQEEAAGFSEESLKRLLEQEILEKLKIENEDKKKCVICMDCDINSAFFPCGHITCCTHCAPKNDVCPLCRVAIERTERIYLPG